MALRDRIGVADHDAVTCIAFGTEVFARTPASIVSTAIAGTGRTSGSSTSASSATGTGATGHGGT
jgi:hypothetical protein